MSQSLQRSLLVSAYRLVGLQALVAIAIALIMLLDSKQAAYSALLGGAICVIANAYFALRLFRCVSARALGRIAGNFYKAEFFKLLLTAVLFYLAIKFVNLAILPFFGAYIAIQMVQWLSMVVKPVNNFSENDGIK